jgi:hypothetical protein
VKEPTPPQHYVVLIVIDAGRTNYLTLPGLKHLQDLIRHGVVYNRAWVGELNSSTPDVHVTLGTGALPRESGFLGFGWADPVSRRVIDFRTLLAHGEIDPVLKSLPLPSIATRLHQLIPGARSIAASGHKDYAAVGLGGGTADYELYGKYTNTLFLPTFMHSPPPLTPKERAQLAIKRPLARGAEDTWAFKYASLVASHVKPRLLMLNIPETDTWGHWFGPNDNQVMSKLMKNVDAGIGEIERTYRKLGILKRTDFVITADHGMMESIPARNWRQIQTAAAGGAQKVARADGESGAIWLQDPTQAQAAAQRIVAIHPAHVEAVFYRSRPGNDYTYVQASPATWTVGPFVDTAYKSLVDTAAGLNGPDVWVIFRENYTVVPKNVQGTWKGTHGGASWKVQHIPLIISGPGVHQGIHSNFPARSIDIAPTIERLLGLPAIHRDGVILGDALINATKYELQPQKTIASQLNVDVNALERQSQFDVKTQHVWPSPPPPLSSCKPQGNNLVCDGLTIVPSNG